MFAHYKQSFNPKNSSPLCAGLVLIAYFCAGLASLIYQVSWEQAMEKIVGMALPTVAMIIGLFLLGMAIGALVFSKSWFKPQWAGAIFVTNQFLLFLCGLAFVATHGLNFLCSLSVGNPSWLLLIYLIRLFSIAIFLLIPAILMGAGFPLLLKLSQANDLDNNAQKLYFYNILGSIAGALLAGFLFLPHFGIAKSTVFAALVNLFAGLVILTVSRILALPFPWNRQLLGKEHIADAEIGSRSSTVAGGSSLLWAIFILVSGAGFFNMLLELLFIRFYSLIIGSSLYSYALVLAIQLAALACGTYLIGKFKVQQDRLNRTSKRHPLDVLVCIYMLAGAWLILDLFFISQSPLAFIAFRYICQSSFTLPADLAFMLGAAVIVFSTMFVPALFLGAILPGYFQARQMDVSLPQPSQMYGANLIGSLAGCLVGGIVLIPLLNLISNHAIQLAFTIIVAALFGCGCLTHILLCWPNKSAAGKIRLTLVNKELTVLTATILTISITIVWHLINHQPEWSEALLTGGLSYLPADQLKAYAKDPAGIMRLSKAISKPLLFYKEGLNAIVSVSTNQKLNIISLKTNGQMEAAIPINPSLPSPTSDEKTQILLGLLPSLYCLPAPKNVFLLGFGAGVTAQTILRNPHVKELMVAELEPAVINASEYFKPYFSLVFAPNIAQFNMIPYVPHGLDKRLKIDISDGRSLLSMLNKRYEAIISQPGEPSRSSCAHLYTLEFWQLAKSRLRPGGVFCQWLPLYAIDQKNLFSLCRTFSAVFPDTCVFKLDQAGEIILLGINSNNQLSTKSIVEFNNIGSQLLIRESSNYF